MPKKKVKLPLSKTHPKLAKEADGWDPMAVTFGSGKKLKWKCIEGHVWQASPNTRSGERGRGCPYCSGRYPVIGVNDLKTTHPELAKQAVDWNPKEFSAGSGKKVKWKCEKGHVCSATISSRAIRGSECGVCSGREVLAGFNDLATQYPSVAKELVDLNPRKIFARSERIVNWRCKKGHSWRASVSNRTRLKSGCPFCTGQKVIVGKTDILTTHPDIASQAYGWNPADYSIGSGIDLKWKCKEGHIWQAKPQKRRRGDGCTICSGNILSVGENDLQTTHPQLASQALEWDPRTVTAGHNLKKKWKCEKGHIWQAIVNSRSSGVGCPVCAGRVVVKGFNDLKTINPELAKQALGWNPEEFSVGTNRSMLWRCKLGHEWKASIGNRGRSLHCPTCIGKVILKGFNDLATTHPELARQAVDWDPTTFTSGSSSSNKVWICDQGHKWKAKIANRTKGSNCPTCSKTGYDPNKKGWLYFMQHERLGYLQIGITNFPDNRIQIHQKDGWELLELRGPMDGYLASDWETAILKMLRSKKVQMGPAKSDLNKRAFTKSINFVGTEMWRQSSFFVNSIKELMRLTEEFEEEMKSQRR